MFFSKLSRLHTYVYKTNNIYIKQQNKDINHQIEFEIILVLFFFFNFAGVCNAWTNSHYLTFDGLHYDFRKNCSYYLVKEIRTKYNLTITVKYDCDDSKSSFCPRTLTVIYKSSNVVFSQLGTSLMVGLAIFIFFSIVIKRQCIIFVHFI